MRRLSLFVVLIVGLVGTTVPPATAQIAKLPRPASADSASFGVSVAMDDSIAVVGASGEASCGRNAGAVYVYRREAGVTVWRNTTRLTPTDCRKSMFFGEAVAVSGTRILVGASSEAFPTERTDAAYVFERTENGQWEQTARLTGNRDREEGVFAAGLDLQGDRAVVSTSGSSEAQYGGAVYVFEYRSDINGWRRTTRLTASRGVRDGVMGHAVTLDGDHLAVAASTFLEDEPGSVYVFHYDAGPGTWHEEAHFTGIETFFIDLDLHGTTLVVGEDLAGNDESGEASVYRKEGHGTWRKETTLRPGVPYESGAFGTTVSVYDGSILVAGYNEQLGKEYNIDRVVYAFRRGSEAWHERTVIDIGKVDFGAAMAQGEGIALISSVPDGRPGTVYVVGLP